MAKEKFVGKEVQIEIPLQLFVVVNSDGRFYKSSGWRENYEWTDNINSAKLYKNAGGARGVITRYVQNNKKDTNIPKLGVLTFGTVMLVDQKERTKKAIDKIAIRKEERDLRNAEWSLKHAIDNKARAEEEIRKAKKKLDQKKAELNK